MGPPSDDPLDAVLVPLAELPYPWTSGEGLANALDDPDLWSRVIEDPGVRTYLVRVCQPARRSVSQIGRRRARADDDSSFGYMILDTLRDQRRRAAANARIHGDLVRARQQVPLDLSQILAEQLLLWVRAQNSSAGDRFFPDALTPNILSSSLDAQRFQQRLGELDRARPSVLTVLVACAQAMLRPGDGLRFAATLRGCSSGFERFIVEYWDSGDADEDDEQDGIVDDIEDLDEEPAPPPRPKREKRGKREKTIIPPAAVVKVPTPALSPDTRASADARARAEASAEVLRAATLLAIPAVAELVEAELADPTFASHAVILGALAATGQAAEELRQQVQRAGGELQWPPRGRCETLADYVESLRMASLEVEEALRQRREDERTIAALRARVAPLGLASMLAGYTLAEHIALVRVLGANGIGLDAELLCAAFAGIAHADVDRAARLLVELPEEAQRAALPGVLLEHIPRIAEVEPRLAPLLARTLLVAGVADERMEEIAPYLDILRFAPNLGPSAALYGACIRAVGHGEPVAALLLELITDELRGPATDTHSARLLELIDRPPGMVGTYHRLRVAAQDLFFRPLRADIMRQSTAVVRATWRSHGDEEDMIAACIREIPDSVREVGDTHVEQTRRYLRNFDAALQAWADGGGNLQGRAGNAEIVEAWAALTATDPTRSRLIDLLREDESATQTDLGRRFAIDTAGHLCITRACPLSPELVHAWIGSCQGTDVPLAAYLTDLLRVRTGAVPDRAAAVQDMLTCQRFAAARRAAEGDTGLTAKVQAEIDVHRHQIEERHASALNEALALRAADPAIDEYLQDLEAALHALDMAQAGLWLAELGEFLRERERERDPERRAAVDFLLELDSRMDLQRASREDLLGRVIQARSDHENRRWHVVALYPTPMGPPTDMALRLRTLADELDHPALWPDESASLATMEAIETILRFVSRHTTHYQRYNVDAVGALSATVGPWLAEALRAGLPDRPRAVLELAGEIRDFSPVQRVAELLAPRGDLTAVLQGLDMAARRDLAREHYSRGEYSVVASLPGEDDESELLRACAQIMVILRRGAPLDIHWATLRGVLESARRTQAAGPALLDRLAGLDAIAEALQRSSSTGRVIDHLASAGPNGYEPPALRAVLFVLSLHLQVASTKPPTEGFALAMVLPEQIFRVWARWRLGLDMTRVPPGRPLVWQMVESEWDPDGRGNRLRIPSPGEPFPSFRCFALFAQTELLLRGGAGTERVLERGLGELHAALRTLRIRNDGAHAISRPAEAQREQFFGLINRWLEQLFHACPLGDGGNLRASITTLLEPLPLE
jgi:hypothetical protein